MEIVKKTIHGIMIMLFACAIISQCAPTIACCGCFPGIVTAKSNIRMEGDGTVDHPYKILNIDQFQNIQNGLDAFYELANDINAADTKIWNWDDDHYRGFIPIGDVSNPFKGYLNGNNFSITNLFINCSYDDSNTDENGGYVSCVGIFGAVDKGGKISNLFFNDVEIIGQSNVGGLIGQNDGCIESIRITGKIRGPSEGYTVGGLIGWNNNQIKRSSSGCYVEGSADVGGLVGFNGGAIDESYSTGDVYGTHGTLLYGGTCIGGLVGSNYGLINNSNANGNVIGVAQVGGLVGSSDGVILNSFARGNVNGEINSVGGFIGDSYNGIIRNCYATGNVQADSAVGGFIGTNLEFATIESSFASGNIGGNSTTAGGFCGMNYGIISNSYSRGNVTGESVIGGFTGYNMHFINHSYSTGKAIGLDTAGGFIGLNEDFPMANLKAIINNSFWDVQTSGKVISDGGTGTTTSQMMRGSTYSDVGWNFETVWDIEEGKGYPFLRWEKETPIDPVVPEMIDTDDDGIPDDDDKFPTDPLEWNDTDNDGVGDNSDVFIHEPSQWADSDGDGYGDNLSGVDPDRFPDDPGEWNDTDLDGVGDNSDAFPFDVSEWDDSDDDGVGDNSDAFPNDPAASTDYDSD